MAVDVGGDALQIAGRKIEQSNEVVDHAMQLGIADQAGELGVHLEPAGRADVLERGHGDRREPHLRPRERRSREERYRFAAEYLVADRLVEQVAARQADRVSLALIQDALGFEEQGLAEALGADDDELVVPARGEEGIDLGRSVQQRLVEIVRNTDVIGVDSPRAHRKMPPDEQ